MSGDARPRLLAQTLPVALALILLAWMGLVMRWYAADHGEALRAARLGPGVATTALCGLFIFACAASVGEAVLGRFHPVPELLLRVLTSVAIGTGLLGNAVYLLGFAGMLQPGPVLALLLLSLAVGARRIVPDLAALAGRVRLELPIVLGAVLGSAALVSALAPPNYWDELATHLALPARAVTLGYFPLVADDFSFLPQLAESLTAAGILVGAPPGVGRMLHLLFGVCLAGAVYGAASAVSPDDRWARWFSVFMIVVEPITIDISRVAGVDLALVFYGIIAVTHVIRDGSAPSVFLAGLCGGFGLGLTYRGVHGAVALAGAVLAAGHVRALWALVAGGFAAAFPWYFRNFLLSGNPAYPFLKGLFPTREPTTAFAALGWPKPELSPRHFGAVPAGMNRGIRWLLMLPWNATFHGFRGVNLSFDTAISPLYLASAPLFAFAKRLPRPVVVWLVYAGVHSLSFVTLVHTTRYNLAVFAAFAIVFPAVLRSLRWEVLAKAGRWAAIGICAWFYVSGLVKFLDRADTRYVFGNETRDQYLVRQEDAAFFSFMLAINQRPRTEGVFMVGEHRHLYFNRPVLADMHLDNLEVLYRNSGGTPDGMYELLKRSGIKHIVQHDVMAALTATPGETAPYFELLKTHTTLGGRVAYEAWYILN